MLKTCGFPHFYLFFILPPFPSSRRMCIRLRVGNDAFCSKFVCPAARLFPCSFPFAFRILTRARRTVGDACPYETAAASHRPTATIPTAIASHHLHRWAWKRVSFLLVFSYNIMDGNIRADVIKHGISVKI